MKATLFVLVSLALCQSAFGDIKIETVSVPMRDGIKLATDVYRDETVIGPPVGDPQPSIQPLPESHRETLANMLVNLGYEVHTEGMR